MIFTIPIGDWSDDGHGKQRVFHAEADCETIEQVREAYFAAQKRYPGLNPEGFCAEYDDSLVPSEVVLEAAKLGFEIDADNFWCEEMAGYVAWFIGLGGVKCELLPPEKNHSLPFCGYDEKKRHVGFIGYGLFV